MAETAPTQTALKENRLKLKPRLLKLSLLLFSSSKIIISNTGMKTNMGVPLKCGRNTINKIPDKERSSCFISII
jgi:hypothetical protein